LVTAIAVTAPTVTITATWTAIGIGAFAGNSAVTVTTSTQTGLYVDPAAVSIPKGLTAQATALALYGGGSAVNVTTGASWSSSNAGVASVGASTGLITAVTTGTATVTASYGGFTAPTAVTVVTAVLESIAVTPPDVVVIPTSTQAFTATGTYSDGTTANLTGSATWTSSNTSVATVGASTGIATATSTPGVAVISATSGAITGGTAFIVSVPSGSPTLDSITATPNTVVLVFSADVDNLQVNPGAWTVGIIGNPVNVAPVTVTAVSVVGATVTLTTTTQTGGATYVLNVPPGAIFSVTGYPWLGPFAQDFTGGAGLTNTFVVKVIDAQTLLVTFQRPVLETGTHGALQTVNYSLNEDNPAILGVTAVTAAQYLVFTMPQTYGTEYTLTVSNVWDVFNNPI
jgi:trimeric autotransporter adhesin